MNVWAACWISRQQSDPADACLHTTGKEIRDEDHQNMKRCMLWLQMAVCNEKSMWWFRGYDSYLLIELVWKQIWPLTRRCLDIFMFCNPQMCWTWCLIHFCSTSTAVWRHELIILWLNQEHFTLEAAEVHQIYCVVWLFLWKIDKLNCHQKGS